MSKKTRGPNFTANEKEILVHLVTKYKDIIENKKTDAVTTTAKNELWIKLSEEFNSSTSFCIRKTDQLKTCWDNIKRMARKEKANTKKETFLTGGGRPDPLSTEPFQSQVDAILGPTLDGLKNDDSDAQFSQCLIVTDEKETINTSMDEVQLSENKESNSSWSPTALKTKISNKLTKNKSPISKLQRRRLKTSLQDKLLESKLELVEMTKKNMQTEAEMKFKILQEQLNQEKLKTKILQLQLLR